MAAPATPGDLGLTRYVAARTRRLLRDAVAQGAASDAARLRAVLAGVARLRPKAPARARPAGFGG
jgi:hypothetical protein